MCPLNAIISSRVFLNSDYRTTDVLDHESYVASLLGVEGLVGKLWRKRGGIEFRCLGSGMTRKSPGWAWDLATDCARFSAPTGLRIMWNPMYVTV